MVPMKRKKRRNQLSPLTKTQSRCFRTRNSKVRRYFPRKRLPVIFWSKPRRNPPRQNRASIQNPKKIRQKAKITTRRINPWIRRSQRVSKINPTFKNTSLRYFQPKFHYLTLQKIEKNKLEIKALNNTIKSNVKSEIYLKSLNFNADYANLRAREN